MAGGAAVEALRERVTRLEELLGASSSDFPVSISDRLENLAANLESLAQNLAAFITECNEKNVQVMEDVVCFTEAVKARVQVLEGDVAVFKSTASSHAPTAEILPSKIKVPDPKPFNGARNAKELENFLWDMEQYFLAAHCPDHEKVMIASMYLTGDAKLWWRTRMQDDEHADRPKIHTWERLWKELRDQFLPCNTAWVAREALKKLKHVGSIRDYVTEFSSLMLAINNMSEEDKLFNFVSGLQVWAQAELKRQGVKTLPMAIAAAEGLVDYMAVAPSSKEKKKGVENQIGGGPKEGSSWAEKRGKDGDSSKAKWAESSRGKGNSFSGCFICNGPHRARECPKKQSVTAVRVEEGDGEQAIPLRMAPLMLLDGEGTSSASNRSMRTSNSGGVGGLLAP